VLTEAAGELGPVADYHDLAVEPNPAVVSGVRDDLHRLALNLIENALRHTPPGTHVRARTATENGNAILVVEDDGPGIAPELQRRIFDRFVRGGRDGGRGSGLGLAIVRAVAESHGGSVTLEQPSTGTGTRFVIRIPLEQRGAEAPATHGNGTDPDAATQTSTTTGSTIGRRRNRS
jgi:signal transduction histidine kinase